MAKFDISEYQKDRPMIQMAPMIDIVFLTLIFFMTISLSAQMEPELNINVPKSKVASEQTRGSGDIVVNITREGKFVVNQDQMGAAGLEELLKKVVALFPEQQVIIRADENTFHKFVVQALDACARANISNISFSTAKEEIR